MIKIKKIIAFYFIFFLTALALAPTTYAICPVCTVAVGAGLGLSRWLGIDDSVSSIWIGGLILSSSLWAIDWLYRKKKLKKENQKLKALIIIATYAIILVPLWMENIIGHPYNTILGIDKIIFGTVLGSLGFLFGIWADKKIRKIKGKQLIQYQKVITPVSTLLILSLVLYFWGGYLY